MHCFLPILIWGISFNSFIQLSHFPSLMVHELISLTLFSENVKFRLMHCHFIWCVFKAAVSVSHAPQPRCVKESPCIELAHCHYTHITFTQTHTHTYPRTNTIPRRLFPEWRCRSEITMTGCRVEIRVCVCLFVTHRQASHTESPPWWSLIVWMEGGGQKWPRAEQRGQSSSATLCQGCS